MRYNFVTPIKLVLGMFVLLLVTMALSPGQTNAQELRELHFFVIDRSGSMGTGMNNLVAPVTEVFRKQINQLPSNAEVRLVFFSSDRTRTQVWKDMALKNQLAVLEYFQRNFTPNGQTRLYDTVAESLEEILRDQSKYGHISLQIFSDGADNASSKSKNWLLVEKLAKDFIQSNPTGFLRLYAMGKTPPAPAPEPIVTILARDGEELKQKVVMPLAAAPDAIIKIVPESPVEVGANISFLVLPGKGAVDTAAWTFSDGSTANGTAVERVFAAEGQIEVTLKVVGPGGEDTARATLQVKARAKLHADFSFTPNAPKVGDTIMLFDESDGAPQSWQWVIDGKTVGQGQRVEYPASAAGKITVRLAISREAETKQAERTITILPAAPKADFEMTPSNSVRFGDKVTFRALNSQTGETYRWTLDGKAASTDREWTWQAAQVGGVEVGLTVTNASGASDPRIKPLIVAANPPDAAFTTTPNATTIKIGDKLVATAATKSPGTSHVWTFAGGTISTSHTAEVTPAKIGSYELVHIVTSDGGTEKASRYLTVAGDPPPAGFSITPGKEVDMGTAVTMKADSTSAELKHTWTLASGQTIEGPTATVTVSDAGMFKIIHKVSGLRGDNTASDTIYVRAILKIDFDVSAEKGDAPLSVTFTPKTAGNIATYKWDFDDNGATSDDRVPTHVYQKTGNYAPRLVVQTAAGQEAKSQTVVNISVTQPSPWWLKWAIIGGIMLLAAIIGGGYLLWRGSSMELFGKLSWERDDDSGRRELHGKLFELKKLSIDGWEPKEVYIIKGTNGGGMHVYKNDAEYIALNKDTPSTKFKIGDIDFTYRP